MINVKNFSYWFPESTDPSLINISLDIKKGQIITILGPSKSGKTSLCYLISGAIFHLFDGKLEGEIFIENQNPRQFTRNEFIKTVGLVSQNPETMFCNLRVKEEVAFSLESSGCSFQEMEKRVTDILEKVGLSGFENRNISELSGGEIQRLGIACGLVMKPKILVLDEPFSSIDPMGKEEFYETLRELKENGTTIIISSKVWDQYTSDSNYIYILKNGEIIDKGQPKEIVKNLENTFWGEEIILPTFTTIALDLKKKNVNLPYFPISIDEAVEVLGGFAKPKNFIELNNGRSSSVALQINRLSFSYSKGSRTIDHIDLVFPENKIIGLLGKNGAGKSTLAKLIAGILQPSLGEIIFLADELSTSEKKDRVGYVFQNPSQQFLCDSVFDEVSIGLKLRGLSKPEIYKRVEAILDEFGLKKIKEENPFFLSEGEKRLVAIASIAIYEPQILIIDEPTHGQDKKAIQKLKAVLNGLKKNNITIILISHNLQFIEDCSDHVVVLKEGNVAYQGDMSKFFLDEALVKECGLLPSLFFQFIIKMIETTRIDLSLIKNPRRFVEWFIY